MPTCLYAQKEPYNVKKVPWSSDKYDEFSPVYYKQGLVFSSNRNTSSFNINFVDTTDKAGKDIRLFSNNLTSRLNDGPASFNLMGDTIYFSRNLITEGSQKELSGLRNRLGIFYAVLHGDKWTNINELRFNSDSYNTTTPYLSPDGKLLYFASDRPDGYGGSDLYVCSWNDGYWSNPENLGPVINTVGNEAYPFINDEGELFFSSDGHPGKGGKDIFFSKYADSAWIAPVSLYSPVNSGSDDFGYVSKNGSEGYFTSSRSGSIDIYRFKAIGPLFLYCPEQRENSYCFSFPDDLSIDIDPLNLQFQWDFGDGTIETGYVVQHCFPGKGIYTIRQNIIDKKTGKFIFNKLIFELELTDSEQPFIKSVPLSPDGDSVSFDARSSYLPGENIIAYNWDFGDGEIASGELVNHRFRNTGFYNVKLEVKTTGKSSGKTNQECISADIAIGNLMNSDTIVHKKKIINITDYDNSLIDTIYSSSHEIVKNAIFQVIIQSSKSQLKLNDKTFSAILPRYAVREVFQAEENIFTYVIDEGINFMDVYPSYSDAVSRGFGNSVIKTILHSEPGELELWRIKKTFGTSTDNLFKSNDTRLISGEIPVLDEVADLLLKNKNIKLQVAVHTDNAGNPASNQVLSLNRAKSIVDYLVKKGTSRDRIVPAGYGGTRPVVSNYSEADRRKNRRYDLIILSNN
jgi:outer membrane protein OmpA-like peptidoglycan-associated protein